MEAPMRMGLGAFALGVMPKRPQVFRPTSVETREQARRRYDRERSDREAWRAWYNTTEWRRIRAEQLATHPVCAMCEAEGMMPPAHATVCDHVIPHRGDWTRFVEGPFQSLCAMHHASSKQAEERGGGGV